MSWTKSNLHAPNASGYGLVLLALGEEDPGEELVKRKIRELVLYLESIQKE